MNHKIMSKITAGVLLCTMLAYTTPVLALTKEETVYTKLDVNGSGYKTIVSNHLINEEQEDLMNDLSNLINIKNVGGNQELSQEENKLIWKAAGDDIYYQGETKKELPIDCKVSYELDGKEITAQELAGKSGKVKITLEYTNKEEHNVKINGKSQKLYTPFVVACGTIINNQNNKNIQITNGKVIDNGNKTIVMAISMPGMQESLGISKEKLEIPSKVEITMETTDFELNNIVTYITPKLIEDTDLKAFDKLDEIYSKMNTLKSSSTQLVEGANTLKEGTTTYAEKSKEFHTGVKTLEQGVTKASLEYKKLDDGIAKLNEGTTSLNLGAKQISTGTKAMQSGIETISSKMEQLELGSNSVLEGAKKIDAGVSSIQKEVEKISKQDNTAQKAQLNTLIKTNNTTITTMKTQIATTLKAVGMQAPTTEKEWENLIAKANSQQEPLKSNLNLIKLLTTNNQALNQTLTTLENSQKQLQTLNNGLTQIKTGLEGDKTAQNPGLVNGAKAVTDGVSSLKTQGVDELKKASSTLTAGSSKLYEGTKELKVGTSEAKKGSTQVKSGLTTLQKGATTLLDANSQLTQGASTLSNGATTLAEGMTKFDKEGIQTIYHYINGEVKDITQRLEKLQELAEEYHNFTMLEDGTKGNVKFIMMMDGISKENAKQEMILDNKNGKVEE